MVNRRPKSDVFAILIFIFVGIVFVILSFWVAESKLLTKNSENQASELVAEDEVFRSDTPPVQIRFYRAQNGDNLWNIAKRNGLDWYTILSVNNMKNASDISIGELLKIPDRRGIVHIVSKDEALEDIALRYDMDIKKITGANRIRSYQQIQPNLELFIPDANISVKQSLELITSRGITATKPFIFPISGRRWISSYFGNRVHPIYGVHRFHRGVDIPCRYNSTVRATRSGRVSFAGWMGGYGNLVVINHGDGYLSRYGHNSSILVRRGQYMRQGDAIAKAGSTGLATGPHLHVEIWKRGKPQDPLKIVPR